MFNNFLARKFIDKSNNYDNYDKNLRGRGVKIMTS